MVFKCPKCSYRGTHKQVMKHYYSKHHKYAQGSVTKSKDKKVHVFKPIGKRRK